MYMYNTDIPLPLFTGRIYKNRKSCCTLVGRLTFLELLRDREEYKDKWSHFFQRQYTEEGEMYWKVVEEDKRT